MKRMIDMDSESLRERIEILDSIEFRMSMISTWHTFGYETAVFHPESEEMRILLAMVKLPRCVREQIFDTAFGSVEQLAARWRRRSCVIIKTIHKVYCLESDPWVYERYLHGTVFDCDSSNIQYRSAIFSWVDSASSSSCWPVAKSFQWNTNDVQLRNAPFNYITLEEEYDGVYSEDMPFE